MDGKKAADLMRAERSRLMLIVRDFTPGHEHFRPADGMMDVAQQVNHVARTIDWFREGGFGARLDQHRAEFDAGHPAPVNRAAARAARARAYETFITLLESRTPEQLMEPLPPNAIMDGAPRVTAVHACNDHTAHHRGVLSVYLRLLGVTPAMVYAEG